MTDIQQDGRARRQQDIVDLNRTTLIDTAVDVINEVGDIREVTLTQIAKKLVYHLLQLTIIFLTEWKMYFQRLFIPEWM